MPLDYSPEPLGFRGLGVTPLPDKTTAPTIEGLRDTDYVTDAPGQDEPRDKPTLWEDLGTLATGVGTALTMKGSFAQAARRQREGQPFFTEAQRRLVDVGGAAMRQENWIVGLRQHAPDFGDVDPEHNPIAELWGTPLAVYWPYFIGSRNASETEWLRQKLDRELKDRQTLEENPITGSVLSMGAALLSPTTLLPGGALFHGATGSTKLIAMAKSFAAVGSANAIAAGIDEYILHRQQMARTGLESTFAVGGALLLGGAFGATLSRMGSKRAGRLLEALEKEIQVPARSEDDPFGIGGLNTARGVGAEVTDAKPPVQLEGTGIGIERWMRFQDPVLRTLNNPIRSAREAGTQLFETVLGVTRNAEGFTTAPVGGAVETRIKTQGHARLGEAMRQMDELFGDYYFGKTDASFAAARSQVNRWMGDQRLSYKKYKEEIGRALNRNDEHPIPQVAAAAKLWRKVLIDPIADAAVKLKMLDAEQVARGRPKGSGGAAPSGGTPSPQTPRGPGPGGTGSDASPEFPFDIQRMRQLEVNLQELQNSLGLPPMDQALRDAFLQRIGKALEDVTVDPATRALVDILEGRAPRAEIDPELAKQLREALQAQRAAEGTPTATDLQKAASDALERLDEVLPEGFGPKAMKMLDDAFQGKMPSVDEIVDLFRPKMAEVEISPVSPFRIRENAIKGEVEAIVDMWRMVATVPRNPPEGLVSWLVRSGGVVDAQGDIAAMLGAGNKRPGLLRKPGGPQLDDVALRAWEEGFLPGEVLPDGTPGRPTINQLLDAIRDDLSAGHPAERVIRAADREAMDLWLQAGEFRRELRDMGISSRMGEPAVEKLARKFATERYDSGVDGPASAALAAHSGSVLRVIDRMMETGKTWTLPYASHQKIKEALGDTIKRAADDTVVGAVERLEPIGWMTWNGKRTPKVEVTFRTFDDELVNVVLPWGQARHLRAAHFPAGSIPGRDGRAVVFFRTTLGSDIQLRKTLGGELVHELVHNQVRDLGVSHVTRPLWDRLVRHAESLRILEMDQKQYMAAISHPSASLKLDDLTMRQKYEEQYRGRPDIDQAIREESVAHLFELRHHGQLMKSELEPIADILQAFDRNDLKSQSVLDELLAAEQARLADESAAIDAQYAEMRAASEQMMFALGPVKRWLGWQRPVDGALNRGGADAGQPFGAPARISREQFLSMAKRLPKKARAVGDVSVLASVSGDYVEYFVVPKGQRSPWGKDGFLSNPLGSFTVGRGQNGGIEITNASLADDIQRRGIGSAVYDLVERDFPGFTLMPSPWNQLSEAAVQFWAKRAPQKLAYQRRRAAQDLGGDLYPERVIPGEQPMFALGPTDRKTRPNFTQRLYERIREEVADDLSKPKPKAGEDPPTFDPETGRVIFDDEGQTYVTRLYNREKIIAERQQFRDILIAHFAAGQKRAEGLLKSITDDIKAGRRAPDAKTEQQIEQLRQFTGLEQQELRGIADGVTNHILGAAEGRMVYDLPPAVRGPLKARTLRIRDELIEDYLDRDVERIGRFYMRTMVPDIEMTRMFGSLDMKEQIAKIRDEAVALADANPKLNKKIHDAADRAVKDLTAIADRMRGTYMLPEDPTALLPRIGSVVRTLNYLRLLGGMTISALPDTARIVMTHGFVATYRDGLMPLVTNLQAVKAAGREVKLAGTALDMILDTRAMAMADVLDDFGRYSKFERGLQKAQEHFGVMSLMAPWNAAMKQWTGMIVMSNILREGERLLMGKSLSKAAMRRLAASNIDEDTLRIVAEQWKKHGDKNGSVYLPNSAAWDVDSPRVQLALEAFRGAIVRDVDRIVVTVGQDKPLWMSTQIGKIVGQFKSFGVASVQRTLIAGLQERDAGVAMGFAMAIGLGAVVEALKNQIAGKKNPENMKQWVVNAIDKSGLTGWLFDVNHFTERFTGGTVGLSALTGRPVSRYASRNWADAIGGPSAGLLKDLAGSNASLFRWAFNGEKPTEADVRALRRTVPLQNLFYLAWLFRELEEGTAKAIGARPFPKRN